MSNFVNKLKQELDNECALHECCASCGYSIKTDYEEHCVFGKKEMVYSIDKINELLNSKENNHMLRYEVDGKIYEVPTIMPSGEKYTLSSDDLENLHKL